MRLAIKHIGNKIPSKKTGGTCITVIFKDVDTNDEYKLYLDDTFSNVNKWLPHLKKGNVFDNVITLQNPKFKNVIDSNCDFKIVREIKEKEFTLEYNLEVTIDGHKLYTHTFNSDEEMITKLHEIDVLALKYRDTHAN